MKKSVFILLTILFGMVACNSNNANEEPTPTRKEIDFNQIETNDFHTSTKTGELSAFNLVSPANDDILDFVGEFSWTESENVETYTLEICSSPAFITDIETVDYYVKKNITTTSFNINSALMYKNTNYYWRVTANNSENELTSSTYSFFVRAPEVEEVEFDIGDADDWTLHSIGSYADISIDSSNFFENNKDSLVIQFKEEDTNQGIEESDGWVIVSKTIERSIYGTDSFFFNMYYSGQDARVIIRMVDRDNEYWYTPVQISNNAKQNVIVKFSDFIQRTKDVPVNNEVFDYERIKYFEVVFEESFGDGVFLLSNPKAIKFSNYADLFIDKLNFTKYGEAAFVNDNYAFEKEVSSDELTLKYYGKSNPADYDATGEADKPKLNDSDGYGFVKLNVNSYLYSGNALKIKVKYTGKLGSSVVIRVYEEDTDRWSYEIPYSALSDEYQELIIPFNAFAKSSIQADGKRQFYYIFNFQFGVRGQYGSGTVSFKDFEIVMKEDYFGSRTKNIGMDGLIENFESYTYTADIYRKWDLSQDNKDEYATLNTTYTPGTDLNTQCGQFEYKADMKQAVYSMNVNVSGNFNALSVWLKDRSVKDLNSRYNYIKNFGADVLIYIELSTKELYGFEIKPLSPYWNEYVIPYTSFTCLNELDLKFAKNDITTGEIVRVGIGLKYYYYDSRNNPIPCYANSNPVLIDDFYFTNSSQYSATEREKVIRMDGNTAMIEDFESYSSTGSMSNVWKHGTIADYQIIELSNSVASTGGAHSGSFTFKTKADSPSYLIYPTVDSEVDSDGVKISLYSDVPATVYVNFIVKLSSGTVKFRAQLTGINTSWTEYKIGFANFEVVEGNKSSVLKSEYFTSISYISIGVAYSGTENPENKQLLVDNFMFDATLTGEETGNRASDRKVLG